MKRIGMKRQTLAIAGAFILTALTSCEYKPLCYDHPDHALTYRSEAVADWDLLWEIAATDGTDWSRNWQASFGYATYNELLPKHPEGIRAVIYNEDGTTKTDNINADGGIISMSGGRHAIIFYNNDTEHILIDNIGESLSAQAATRSRTRATYRSNPVYGPKRTDEYTVAPPDPLFAHYVPDYEQKKTLEPQRIPFTMKPLVYSYVIKYNFEHGLKYVGLARGAIAGMARSVYLYDGHTGPEVATFLFDAEKTDDGVKAFVHTFGVPDYPNDYYTRADAKYALNLEVRLNNGKVLQFNFDITDQIKRQPHGGVITVGGINISDKDGNEKGGGFDIDVDGWGEWNDLDIDM